MKCIKCAGTTKPVRVAGMEVDQCTSCQGIWFDLGEMEEVLEADLVEALQAAVEKNAGHDAQAAPCPRCGGEGHMVPVLNLGHDIHIDTCPVCYGTWLDGGEIDTLSSKSLLENAQGLFRHLFGSSLDSND